MTSLFTFSALGIRSIISRRLILPKPHEVSSGVKNPDPPDSRKHSHVTDSSRAETGPGYRSTEMWSSIVGWEVRTGGRSEADSRKNRIPAAG